MSQLEISDTTLAGLKLVRRQRQGDARGFLSRLFCADELAAAGWRGSIAQVNHTFTARQGTVRGLHFQHAPHAETKLVSCLRGEVWDVAVDVRQGSSSFLRWHALRLSAENGLALLIPAGFAHGFQSLTEDVEMLYFHDAAHAAQSEGGLNPTDERLSLDWPLPIAELSVRDQAHAALTDAFKGVQL
jgi:dTDP-4-dehydrorhamnose 3,5-epimerase